MGAPVNHKRMRPKAGADPTAAERRHWGRVAAKGCVVTGGPATIHHPTGYADRMGRVARSHRVVVGLAPHLHFHDHGEFSVERLGHRGFYQEWGVDLLAVGLAEEAESVALGILPNG